jgi:citrate lyase subunit beta/citryl-CoA lyase
MPTTSPALEGARSWLFVPGDKAQALLEKAASSGADALIIDLEDAVAPSMKDDARLNAAAAVARVPTSQPIVVRVNGLRTSWWEADVQMAIAIGARAVMVPKTSGPSDLERVVAAIDSVVGSQSDARTACAIVPLIESASGILHAEAIAAARGVVAVALGGEDLAADLGVSRTKAGMELEHALAHLVLACAAAGRGAIDTPIVDAGDTESVVIESEAARALGFTGKLAIHPRQVSPINNAFVPTDAEIGWARSVIGAFDSAVRSGRGVEVVDGQMVDEAVASAARRVLVRLREVEE